MITFSDARIVVTGAGGGVGSALVDVLSCAGARVIGCERPGGVLPEAGLAESRRFDLTDSQATDSAAEAILAGGTPAAVVLNAGATAAETMDDITDAAFAHEMALNFEGGARLSRALLPAMRAAGGGAFVFVSSVNAAMHFGNPAYAAAKAAALAWMRAIAVEEGRYGLRANAVMPGSIRTPAWDARIAADPGLFEKVRRLYPMNRLVEPAEVARAAAFLASGAASGITGAVLPVDAGILAGNRPFLDLIGG